MGATISGERWQRHPFLRYGTSIEGRQKRYSEQRDGAFTSSVITRLPARRQLLG